MFPGKKSAGEYLIAPSSFRREWPARPAESPRNLSDKALVRTLPEVVSWAVLSAQPLHCRAAGTWTSQGRASGARHLRQGAGKTIRSGGAGSPRRHHLHMQCLHAPPDADQAQRKTGALHPGHDAAGERRERLPHGSGVQPPAQAEGRSRLQGESVHFDRPLPQPQPVPLPEPSKRPALRHPALRRRRAQPLPPAQPSLLPLPSAAPHPFPGSQLPHGAPRHHAALAQRPAGRRLRRH